MAFCLTPDRPIENIKQFPLKGSVYFAVAIDWSYMLWSLMRCYVEFPIGYVRSVD